MTTRSLIGMQHGDGSITAIYCQCDGYPSYNGKVLRDHYTDGVQVEELMALGEIDVLGQTPAAFMDDAEKRRDIEHVSHDSHRCLPVLCTVSVFHGSHVWCKSHCMYGEPHHGTARYGANWHAQRRTRAPAYILSLIHI